MSIDLKLLSELREKTAAGLGDCRATLIEADNDLNKAIEILRKKGEIKAAKKADRATKEGIIAVSGDSKRLAVVALACETDFVARTEAFQATVKDFAKKLLTAPDVETFKAGASQQIKDELTMKVGENMQIAEAQVFAGETVGVYVHSNKKVAGICVLSGGSEELANEIAMQIAAMSPKYLSPETVPAEVIEKEKEIYQDQLKSENKPEQIWDKIIFGKLAKFYEENCLINQVYIKDDTKKIKDLLGSAQITEWARFAL